MGEISSSTECAQDVQKPDVDALRAEHAESELFINSVPSILIGTDARGRITRWNLAAANTFGLSASVVCGKSLHRWALWDGGPIGARV